MFSINPHHLSEVSLAESEKKRKKSRVSLHFVLYSVDLMSDSPSSSK